LRKRIPSHAGIFIST